MASIGGLFGCLTTSCTSVVDPVHRPTESKHRAREASTSLRTFTEKEALQYQVPWPGAQEVKTA